ncbi:glycerol dehydrogenase [Candidatus Aerophobetes bacterium]|nr:glycerol dehydrogenase [Candidatus Aerophobetes bacterium]
MSLIIGNPSKYIQGKGALKEIGRYVSVMGGKKVLLMGGRTALSVSKEKIIQSLKSHEIECVVEIFGGESTRSEINRLVDTGKKEGCNFVIGVGGGKAVDAAKAVSYYMETPLALVPTIAATDAACSAQAPIYTDEHAFEELIIRPKNPDIVLTDTEIIVKAPIRFLVAGMGDALSTKFEAEACWKAGVINFHGGSVGESALCLARWCTDTVMDYGVEAKKFAENGEVTRTVEKVVEACVYASSVSFENCGLSVAHGYQVGFTTLKETQNSLHGEIVGFSTCAHVVFENQPKEVIDKVFNFCLDVGLPVTLSQIGLKDPSKEKLMGAIEESFKKTGWFNNEPFKVTAEMLYQALMETDRMGRELLKKAGR